MRSLILRPVTIIWLVLVGATVFSWLMGHGVGVHDLRQASIAILVIAFIKVRFVILDFMEIRGAPLPMRIVGEVWCLVICTVLIALYLHGVRP
jgi:Prokaryotic Cytochrome C oxidase subunit IV